MIERYNFKRIGKAEGVFVHAGSFEEATFKARAIADQDIVFVDNKPCPKNTNCGYCEKKEIPVGIE